MRRFILTLILVFLSIKYGLNYILSEDFQKYGDKKKAPWTCQVNNFIGGLFQIGSNYDDALRLFDRVLARCPQTSMADEAMFQKAVCLEDLHRPQDALTVYLDYKDAFPDGDKTRIVGQAIDRIKFSK